MALTGCTSYEWQKPGATARQAEIAETNCQAQALKDLPPDNVLSHAQASRTDNKTDADFSTADANEDNRDTLVKDCMYTKGWSLAEVKR
jgi:hypothetical protein